MTTCECDNWKRPRAEACERCAELDGCTTRPAATGRRAPRAVSREIVSILREHGRLSVREVCLRLGRDPDDKAGDYNKTHYQLIRMVRRGDLVVAGKTEYTFDAVCFGKETSCSAAVNLYALPDARCV
jgi:hypothetical protein